MTNAEFAAWVQSFALQLRASGHTVVVDYRSGGRNAFYTLPDFTWLNVDGYDMYCPKAIPTIVEDPVAWAETQIHLQKTFGRIVKDQPAE